MTKIIQAQPDIIPVPKIIIDSPKFPKKPRWLNTVSVMRGGKSLAMIKEFYNAEQAGHRPIIIKPNLDTRDGTFKDEWGVATSRAFAAQYKAFYVGKIDSGFIRDVLLTRDGRRKYTDILFDESNLREETDWEAVYREILHELGMPVYTYGLETDVNKNPFPSAAKLRVLAHKTTELLYKCEHRCGDTATLHARFVYGAPDPDLSSVVIETPFTTYVSICHDGWHRWDEARRAPDAKDKVNEARERYLANPKKPIIIPAYCR